MNEQERIDLKRKLREGLAELRLTFDELHKTLEWAELTECYPEASAVYRRIEYLEDIVNLISATLLSSHDTTVFLRFS